MVQYSLSCHISFHNCLLVSLIKCIDRLNRSLKSLHYHFKHLRTLLWYAQRVWHLALILVHVHYTLNPTLPLFSILCFKKHDRKSDFFCKLLRNGDIGSLDQEYYRINTHTIKLLTLTRQLQLVFLENVYHNKTNKGCHYFTNEPSIYSHL